MSEDVFYDSIADEQELMIWSIPIEGKTGVKIAERLKDVVVAAFIKLQEESLQSSFTVFMGDHPGLDVFIGVQKADFRLKPVRDWLEKLIGGSFLTVGPAWRRFSSPADGVAVPLFRYTPTRIKDYRVEDDGQIGQSHKGRGMEMTYFGMLPTFGEDEEYND